MKKNKGVVSNGFKLGMCALLGILSGTPCFAQHGSGNSGEAVALNGKYYLLDLVEANLQNTDYTTDQAFEQSKNDYSFMLRQVADSGYDSTLQTNCISQESINYLSHVLKKLPDYSGIVLASAINSYQWRFLDLPLNLLQDTNPTVSIDPSAQAQLAVRLGQTIKINRNIWKQMSIYNQVATILHEVIYATLAPLTRADGTQFQDAASAMEIVATLMDPRNSAQDVNLRNFKLNEKSKLDFLNLNNGNVYNVVMEGTDASNNTFDLLSNISMIISIPGANDSEGRPLEEHHGVSPVNHEDLAKEFDAIEYCKTGLLLHSKSIQVVNSGLYTQLGFKDYLDENNQYKKYYTVTSSQERQKIQVTNGSNEFKGQGQVALAGKSLNQCVVEVTEILKKVSDSALALYPQVTQ
jgi:hypothetical protein